MSKKWSAIRLGEDGKVDDVAISGDLFRMEQLDDDVFWLTIYRGEKRASFTLSRKGKQIIAVVQADGIGCVDDSKVEP